MDPRVWNRRQWIKSGVAGAMIAATRYGRAAIKLPPPEPLEDDRVRFMTSTETSPWQKGGVFKPAFAWEMLNLRVESRPGSGERAIEGFGACFNELGWTSLSALSEADRESVMHELFDPKAGAKFSYCRMPIGANDFATGAYSYDETVDDFELRHFSIERDRRTLIPFIQAAMRHQPKLRLWASPWSPPTWMKRNHFYAEAAGFAGMKDNGIRAEQIGHEGEDMFLQEPRYFDAYARYFGRFIDAYREEGIRVGMVMPQNEFNSAQNFPSCTWTPEGLARFLRALGPEMQKRGVEVFLGTLERGNPALVRKVMADAGAAAFVQGVGIQWAGKNALPEIRREFPALAIYQSEQECGDGENTWSYTGYCWQLMKTYFRNGATGYMYWNISLVDGGMSSWGWPQNSLISVDSTAKTFRYNHDYYLLKHLTHFVEVGARRLPATGTCDDVLAFGNPDGTAVLLLRNELPHPQLVQVEALERMVVVELPADSVGTLVIGR